MKDKPHDGKPALSPYELLELLENPDDSGSAEAWRHVTEDEASRSALDRLLATEDALALEAWQRAEREADARGPAVISSDLERRVLSIPDQGDIEANGPTRNGPALHLVPPPSIAPEITQPEVAPAGTNGVPDIWLPRRTSGWRYPALALAASMLVAVGMWQVYQDVGPTRPSEVEPPVLRGDGTVPHPASAPVKLLVAPPGSEGEPAELKELEPGYWTAQVPRNVRIQLQVSRPDGLVGDARWTAALSLWRKTTAGQRTPIETPPFELSARAWEQSVDFPDIDMERGTSAWGFEPGDRLEVEIRRGDQRFRIEVTFTPEGG